MHHSHFWVAAHTGSGNAPDNTMDSFLEGVNSGADMVEIDVRSTKDGVAILLHDDSPLLQLYTYKQLNAREMRTQLNPLYAHHDILRLEQILQIAMKHQVKLNLDMKDHRSIEPALAAIQMTQAAECVYFTGCTEGLVGLQAGLWVMMNTPDALTDQDEANYEAFADAICAQARKEGYVGLNMDYLTCRQEIVDRAHASGLVVWVYTVNESAWMAKCISMGVDAITTRNVSSLIQLK
ncbi:glycerophosphodiester phosphodiesterase [Paenibacillus sp. GCM10027629]|uniref:glycerophosphodiester phosphodiesterase n=1 Tax=Paenibacillus sp. GCM10027629 TaxID=3273414 RepID=UPI00363A3D03